MEDTQKFKVLPEEEYLFDKFAAKAMQALLTAALSTKKGRNRISEQSAEEHNNIAEFIADNAFFQAEAMILERRKRKKTTISYYPPVEPTK